MTSELQREEKGGSKSRKDRRRRDSEREDRAGREARIRAEKERVGGAADGWVKCHHMPADLMCNLI